MMDILGQIIGKAARRRLEAEVSKGAGPVLDEVLPIVAKSLFKQAQAVTGTNVVNGVTGEALVTTVASAMSQRSKA